ncbi:hypothetical protein, partial [Mycobacterium tuberculosis]
MTVVPENFVPGLDGVVAFTTCLLYTSDAA